MCIDESCTFICLLRSFLFFLFYCLQSLLTWLHLMMTVVLFLLLAFLDSSFFILSLLSLSLSLSLRILLDKASLASSCFPYISTHLCMNTLPPSLPPSLHSPPLFLLHQELNACPPSLPPSLPAHPLIPFHHGLDIPSPHPSLLLPLLFGG